MVWNGRHFVDLAELNREELIGLMRRASHFLDEGDMYEPEAPLAEKIVANLFLENSTRTRCSFSIAAKRLGGDVVDLLGSTSSVSKGETLVDTALNLEAMGVAALVIRCAEDGGHGRSAFASRRQLGRGLWQRPVSAQRVSASGRGRRWRRRSRSLELRCRYDVFHCQLFP